MKAGNKPPPATPGKPKKATTFQEFESITSDAWDVGDDDDELLAMAAQNLNIEVVMETANKVSKEYWITINQWPWCKFFLLQMFGWNTEPSFVNVWYKQFAYFISLLQKIIPEFPIL